MLVFGLISPHPPIILPEIGGNELPKVKQTIDALERGVRALAASKPDKLIVISPHEDHGFEVPEYFLRVVLAADLPVEEILVTEDSYQYYFDYGKTVGARVQQEKARYAIVASGDLSHVLKVEGPYGFNAAGLVLDELILKAVRQRDAKALLEIDHVTLEAGAECGLRSILFLLGALQGLGGQFDVFSYEGPFGVGYMVATIAPHEIVELARRSVEYYLKTGKKLAVPKELPAELRRMAGAFVSLHGPHGELRGCIGTTTPTKAGLAEEVIANAVAAATRDPRFEPVGLAELANLRIGVDVLGKMVTEEDLLKLNPQIYGIIVTAADGRQGVLLPGLDGVETVARQIEICREKGGIGLDEPVEIAKFRVERFEE